MMGRGLERLGEVPAGCCLAIGGLERAILKSATLSSTPSARPLDPWEAAISRVERTLHTPAARPLAPMLVQALHLCSARGDS